MKQILFAMMLLPFLAKADAVYDKFLDLKEISMVEKNNFYHSLSNGMSGMRGAWRENGWSALIFTATNICSAITNVEYDVDLVKVSTNGVSTNLTCVSKRFLNGETHRYTYDKKGRIEMIEIIGNRLGDFNIYQIDTNAELDAYIATTNFIGVHEVRQYRNGNISRIGPIPNLEIFRP